MADLSNRPVVIERASIHQHTTADGDYLFGLDKKILIHSFTHENPRPAYKEIPSR
jgi:hypothetical protein